MSKFKTGDKVFEDAWCYVADPIPDDTGSILLAPRNGPEFRCAIGCVTPYPGASVAAMLEELDELWLYLDQHPRRDEISPSEFRNTHKACTLRAAREAAMNPGPKEGDEVTIKGVISGEHGRVRLRGGLRGGDYTGISIVVHPDDIKIIKGE